MINSESFKPTETWPLQERYKRDLHERIQRWGEAVAPILESPDDSSTESKQAFFEYLMESVPRGDSLTANLIKTLDNAIYASTESWYSGKTSSPSDYYKEAMAQHDFNALHQIYEAGRDQ